MNFRRRFAHIFWEKPELYGRYRIIAYQKQCSIGFEHKIYDYISDNLVVNNGKASILKYIGNIVGGGFLNSIGVGTGTGAPALTDTDLTGATWKTIAFATDVVYVQPTLFTSVQFGYGEVNFTWQEVGIRDNQGTPLLVARQLTTFAKTSSIRAIIEWQITL